MRVLNSAKRSVYPVNTSVSEVLGMPTYYSVVDITDPVDLAVIVVPAPQVAMVLEQCVQKGVKAAVIISAGFSETGELGLKLENELVSIARQGGIRFIGPNSMGHADNFSHISTLAWMEGFDPGAVAVISQSGNFGEGIIYSGMASGIGYSKFVSSGNEADLGMSDYLEYFAQDENTRIITAYIEGLREGRRFFELAKKITIKKPVVVIKSGATEVSACAARSHSGALVGSDVVYTAAFKQAGVIRVNDEEDMSDVVIALLKLPLPRNNRVGILTIGGGLGVQAAEACEKAGLAIAPLSPATMDKLNDYLPPRWSHGNPVDCAGMGLERREFIFASVQALLEDDNVDAVLFLIPVVLDANRLAKVLNIGVEEVRGFQEMQKRRFSEVQRWSHEYGKPIFLVSVIPDPEGHSILRGEGIPLYHNPRRVVNVLRHLVWYRNYLDAAGS